MPVLIHRVQERRVFHRGNLQEDANSRALFPCTLSMYRALNNYYIFNIINNKSYRTYTFSEGLIQLDPLMDII